MTSYKEHFAHALGAAPGRLHFAAHSHHLWPDVSRTAHVRCWDDAAEFADMKWERVFEELIPRLAGRVARVLGLADRSTLVFAPSTHELVVRLLSCFPVDRPIRILTSDGEFHSFRRQWMRLVEAGRAVTDVVEVEPFDTFPARFLDAAGRGRHDLVYLSHVMFDSGYVVPNVTDIVGSLGGDTEVVIDGYHHFMAIPDTIGGIAARAFYVAGGYKYAMSGEGACFMHCPSGRLERPVDTGWFAGFGHLAGARTDAVPFAADGTRFAGATFDPAPAYRMDAVLALWERLGVGVGTIHEHVRSLQRRFLEAIDRAPISDVSPGNLIPPPALPDRAHFLTFRTERAGDHHERLLARDVVTDHRADRLRFGFGIYQDASDVDALIDRVRAALG